MFLLDVTLRDGGFVNDFRLGEEPMRRTVSILDSAQVDAIELGYLTGLPPNHGHFPAAQVCYALPIELIADLVAETRATTVAMLHPGGTKKLDYDALAQTGLELVRVTVSPDNEARWRPITEQLAARGIKFTINLIMGSWYSTDVVIATARLAKEAGAGVFYIADTNGAFLPQQVEKLYRLLSETVSIPLGYHAHDFKRMALANVFAAVRGGAEWVDGSVAGIGRSLGNASTEVLQEAMGVELSARYNLLRAIPAILHPFEVERSEELWTRLCAFLNLFPVEIELLERKAQELHTDKYRLAVELLFGREFAHPLSSEKLDSFLAAQ